MYAVRQPVGTTEDTPQTEQVNHYFMGIAQEPGNARMKSQFSISDRASKENMEQVHLPYLIDSGATYNQP